MSLSKYQVGGSLKNEDPHYVERSADEELYQALMAGEFCYIFNSRQMGKSSLLVRTLHRLQSQKCRCTAIDMTSIGSENITPLQWYKGVVSELWMGLKLTKKVNLKAWWREEEEVSLLQRLSRFISEVILPECPKENIVIFVDEIDSVLGLEFPIDDFFALIRFCYNQRAINPEYRRITFALFGVATPSDLILDKTRTPFNIGRAIELHGFQLHEARPLQSGLAGKVSNPQEILKEILAWTGGQPFLTQKLCDLIVSAAGSSESAPGASETLKIPLGTEAFWVESLVRSRVIYHWESQDEPEHLRTIRDRLLRNEQRAGRLLGIYQEILQGVAVPADDSREQIELVLAGLVVKYQSFLKIKNRIYSEVFNLEWVGAQLGALRPYSQAFDAWIASKQQDDSRLLRGRALKDAQSWARGKSLSDLDYQFLAKSEELDRLEVQQGLETARLKEVEARLEQEKKAARRQKILLAIVSAALAIATGLGGVAFWQYVNALTSERKARVSEVQAIASSSQGFFASNNRLNALIQAIQADRKVQQLGQVPDLLKSQVDRVLRQAIYGVVEFNRLSPQQNPLSVDFSPDGEKLATSGGDRIVKVWRSDGTLLLTLKGHQGSVFHVKFSPDGKILASSSFDSTVKLWRVSDGKLLFTLAGHQAPVGRIAFSPDSQIAASASSDSTIKLWQVSSGQLLRTLTGHRATVWGVAFSPDGQVLISGSADRTIKLWHTSDGKQLKTLQAHQGTIWDVECSPQGIVASSSGDKTVKLWTLSGKLLRTLEGHQSAVPKVAFNSDGSLLASSSADKTIKLWKLNGTSIATLEGHNGPVWSLSISSRGNIIASAASDNTVRLWKPKAALLRYFQGHQSPIWDVAIAPEGGKFMTVGGDGTVNLWKTDSTLLKTLKHETAVTAVAYVPSPPHSGGNRIATGSSDGTVKIWQEDGTLQRSINAHKAGIMAVSASPDGQIIASGSDDFTVKLWRSRDGSLIKTLSGHRGMVLRVKFNPDGKTLASSSGDGIVKIWTIDGRLLQTIAAHEKSIWGLDVSRDGKNLVSASTDNTIKIWSRNERGEFSSNPDKTFTGDKLGFLRVAFNPDGETIAAGTPNGNIKIWKKDGTLLTTLTGHSQAILGLAFSPDGKNIVSVSDDRLAILWDLQRIMKLDIRAYGCDWVRDYLRTNAEVRENVRHLCDGIGSASDRPL